MSDRIGVRGLRELLGRAQPVVGNGVRRRGVRRHASLRRSGQALL